MNAPGVRVVGVLCVFFCCGSLSALVPEEFLRGDADDNGSVEQSDANFILDHLYNGGDPPTCQDAADANDDGAVDNSDATYILEYLFNGGDAPPDPGPIYCGSDPSSDSLDCDQFTACE